MLVLTYEACPGRNVPHIETTYAKFGQQYDSQFSFAEVFVRFKLPGAICAPS